ncbi:RNA polymerase sigma factor [Streptomyces sp. NPDC002643]
MSTREPADETGAEAAELAAPETDLDAFGRTRRERLAVDREFSAFYRETVRGLVGFLVNHGASLPDAADIAQDTMARAYRRWTGLRTPRAWVHKVASRAYIRHVVEVREEPVDPPPQQPSPLLRRDAVADWEACHDVLRQVRRLPHRQRQVLAWTISEFTPTEIAEELGMTPEAVRASLRKARRAIAGNVEEGEEQ